MEVMGDHFVTATYTMAILFWLMTLLLRKDLKSKEFSPRLMTIIWAAERGTQSFLHGWNLPDWWFRKVTLSFLNRVYLMGSQIKVISCLFRLLFTIDPTFSINMWFFCLITPHPPHILPTALFIRRIPLIGKRGHVHKLNERSRTNLNSLLMNPEDEKIVWYISDNF